MNRTLERILRAFDILFTVALAGAVVYLGYARFYRDYNALLAIVAMLLGGVVSGVAACVFHECGHLLFGALCRFRFNSLRIGFVRIYRTGKALRVSFGVGGDPSLAGETEMLPANGEHIYGKFLATVCGGLLFSLLFLAGAATSLALHARLPFAAFVFLCTAVPTAFHLFFYNVLPFNDEPATDGALLYGLLRHDVSAMTAVNLLAIEGHLMQGFTPAQIDGKLYFGLPQLPEDDFHFILLTEYRMAYYLDGGDVVSAQKAAQRLESLLEYLPASARMPVRADILFARCAIGGDREGAQALYPAVRGYLHAEQSVTAKRIAAAYELYVNGDKAAATCELSSAERLANECAVPGLAKYERKLIACIRADILSGEPQAD